jgi:hypothetical protein
MPLNDIQKPADSADRPDPRIPQEPQSDSNNPQYFEGGYDPEPNVAPPESPPPGGPAVKPQAPEPKPTDALKGAAEKGAQTAIRRGLDVVTEGATQLPILRNIADWASKNLAREAIKKWAYGLAAGIWGTIGPYATIIIIIVILLFVIAGPAFARIGKARRGADGKSAGDYSSVTDRGDIEDIAKVLGMSNVIPGDPKSYYFSQGDPRWASEKRHIPVLWSDEQTYASAGCGLTVAAMMIRYYGAQDVDPLKYGKYNASRAGTMGVSYETIATYLKEKGGPDKKIVQVPNDLESIKKVIAAGNPILVYGDEIFGSQRNHYVLIIGVSKDDKSLVVNDPAADSPRGRPAKMGSISNINNFRVMYALQ